MNSSHTTNLTDIQKTLLTRVLGYTDSLADLAQCCLVCKSWHGIAEPLLKSRCAAKIRNVPKAITSIMQYSDSMEDLAQLRLVCKSWNAIAEPLMFSKHIQISNLITHLHFDDEYLPVTVQRELLQLAFTPSMERMTGEIDDEGFYMLMNDIASKTSGDRFDKLKAIPHPPHYSAVYNITLLNFKSTLEEITYSPQDENDEESAFSWSSEFESFVNLVKFELDAELETVFNLEDSLTGCSRLQELTLKVIFNDKVHVKNEVEAWVSTNVEIVDTVKKLVITRECRSDLLEFLLFKYPNTNTIEIDATRALIMSNNNLQRTLNIIKRIRSHKVNLAVKNTELPESLKFLMADGIQFRLNQQDGITENFYIEINNL
ncbi:hypothetical protein MBANPS3_002465 [Mucor bainieri]